VSLLDGLNEQQRLAVQAGEGPVLILAGAGSGKTRVLTHRIAYLIFHHGVDPTSIFAVTFTNKAAAEMRHRVNDLVGRVEPNFYPGSRDLWVSTFHSACVRILRSDIRHLGFSNPFTIYDDSDQLSLIKACLRDLNISDNAFSPKAIQGKINKLKNDGIDCKSYEPGYGGFYEETFVRVFERYTESLRVACALDFGDLILSTVRLFQEHPKVLAAYQERFPYVLVDEYQDTNRCQYLLMKLLAGERANLCAVGDEDQSIYRWRGADITNILNFEKDYPNAQIFKLEENYRSTRNIIEAASQVISNNTERREKTLWTQNPEGEKITVLECYDEHDEAQKVANEIANRLAQNIPLSQVAVFYRTNAQSRVLEDLFRGKGINYQIYGGLKFYSRLEVKDTIAYLRLLVNPDDDVSLRRVVNVPARGIGEVTVNRLSQEASKRNISLYALLAQAFGPAPDPAIDLGRARKSLKKFYDTIESLKENKDSLLPSDLVSVVLDETGYRKSLMDENTAESMDRLENLAELRQSVVEFELRSGAEKPDQKITLETFLEEIALVSDIDKFDPDAPALRMMTIHMAKGLEFDLVFIVGLEEELFPNVRPWEEEQPGDVEEERRLFYVGMTRARKKLYMLFAKNRTVFGTSHFRVRSRFIDEVPGDFLEQKKADYFSRRRSFLDRPSAPVGESKFEEGFAQTYETDEFAQESYDDEPSEGLKLGARVTHPIFGSGVVKRKLDGDKIIVDFKGRGPKKISQKFVQLRESD
jgi:DNA helicase II / ATP-dependent DNA helicase PcrA